LKDFEPLYMYMYSITKSKIQYQDEW